jgi:hypothetical protein
MTPEQRAAFWEAQWIAREKTKADASRAEVDKEGGYLPRENSAS